ncbi:chaplin, partial [Kitasatospora sp. NPDC058263]
PVHIPVNLCGNTVSEIGVLKPAYGNHCANF